MNQALCHLNYICIYIISMHQMEQKLLFYLMLMIVSIGIHMNLLVNGFEHSRKYITFELPGICTLFYVDQYFID